MSKADERAPTDFSSMFGLTPWAPEYDVATRMWELKEFWDAGVTVALYDALKHLKMNPHMEPPRVDLGRLHQGCGGSAPGRF
jgi:hypothetical protein